MSIALRIETRRWLAAGPQAPSKLVPLMRPIFGLPFALGHQVSKAAFDRVNATAGIGESDARAKRRWSQVSLFPFRPSHNARAERPPGG